MPDNAQPLILSFQPNSVNPVGSKRWSGSAWLLWRDHSDTAALAREGRLGGSQVGIRMDRQLGNGPIGLYARASMALDAPHAREIAVGGAIRLAGPVPASIGVERRIAIDTESRNAVAIVASGGINPTVIAGNWQVDGYGQAGIVGLHQRDAFADGRMTLAHPVTRALRVGMAVSGGVQPGLKRLDIGPQLDMQIPSLPTAPRLSLEWRQRIGGNAAPGSGLALTLGTNF